MGRNEEAAEIMREALATLGPEEADPLRTEITCELANALVFSGKHQEAAPIIDRALEMAEAVELPAFVARALHVKSLSSVLAGRYEEGAALCDRAIEVGERHQLPMRVASYINAADFRLKRDMEGQIEATETALASAREVGDRGAETVALGNWLLALTMVGRWEESVREGMEAAAEPDRPDVNVIRYNLVHLRLRQGDVEGARSLFEAMGGWEDVEQFESAAMYRALEGLIMLEAGETEPASELLADVVRRATELEGANSESTRMVWAEALAAAISAGRLDRADEVIALLADRPRGHVPPLLRAELTRGQALLAAARGDDSSVERLLRESIAEFDRLGYPYWRARAEVDLGAWLTERGRADEAASLLSAAIASLAELGASPVLGRAQSLIGGDVAETPAGRLTATPVALD